MEETKHEPVSPGTGSLEVEKHLTPGDDERLNDAYLDTLGTILENDDSDARDNLADYLDEIKQESEALGTTPDSCSPVEKEG